MSLTIRERILAKLVEVLATELTGVRVERNRDARVQEFPSIILIDGAQQPFEPESTGFNEYHLTATIEGYVQHEDQSELGPALNDLYGRAIKAVMADRSLGGIAIDTAEGFMDPPSIGRRENQQPTAMFSVEITVKFWTAENDPFELGPGA